MQRTAKARPRRRRLRRRGGGGGSADYDGPAAAAAMAARRQRRRRRARARRQRRRRWRWRRRVRAWRWRRRRRQWRAQAQRWWRRRRLTGCGGDGDGGGGGGECGERLGLGEWRRPVVVSKPNHVKRRLNKRSDPKCSDDDVRVCTHRWVTQRGGDQRPMKRMTAQPHAQNAKGMSRMHAQQLDKARHRAAQTGQI